MKQLFLLMLFLPLFIKAQPSLQCKKCRQACSGCLAASDTLKVKLTNAIQHPIVIDSTAFAGFFRTAQPISNKKPIEWIMAIAPLLISLAAVWFTIRNRRREKVYKDLAFLTDVDKMMVNDPSLWAIYEKDNLLYSKENKEKVAISVIPANGEKVKADVDGIASVLSSEMKLDPEKIKEASIDGALTLTIKRNLEEEALSADAELKRQDKLRAFCYFKLNNFEAAVARQYKGDTKKTWTKYMVHTILNSPMFKNIVKKESIDIIYSEEFKKKLKEYLEIADIVKKELNKILANPNHKDYAAIEAYYNRTPSQRFLDDYFNNLGKYAAFIDLIINNEILKRSTSWQKLTSWIR